MTLPILVGPSTVTIDRDDRFLVCQPDGRIAEPAEEGFFARDTRFVSGWDLFVNGHRPVLLNSSPIEFYSARFEFTNGALMDDQGPVERHSLSIRLDRTIAGGIHEDVDLTNHGRRAVRLTIEVAVASDFADIFDVKSGSLIRRGAINSRWFRARRELRTSYVNREFRRELLLAVDRSDSPPQFANGRLVFVSTIQPKQRWHTCLRWLPLSQGGRRPLTLPCHAVAGPSMDVGRPRLPRTCTERAASRFRLARAWHRGLTARRGCSGAGRGALRSPSTTG